MEKITTIGLDIAKHVFHLHGVNGAGATVSRRSLRRDNVVGFSPAIRIHIVMMPLSRDSVD